VANATDLSDLFASFPAVTPSSPTPADGAGGASTNPTLKWSSSGGNDTALINAEKFDNGGDGVAYHDRTAGNAGGQFRSTDVDIEASSEGGYDVGWIDAGEWLNYTVAAGTAGNYTDQLRVSSR
jgi:hypothetical protein